MTTIRYFIPEDGDMEHQPNIFLAPKSRQQGYPPTLAQIKQSFPLTGRYHFRFKTSLVPGGGAADNKASTTTNQLAVWMDCIDDTIPVPVWQSQIVAKITRIGVEDDDDDEDDDEDFRRPIGATTTTATSSSTSQPSSSNVAVGVPLNHQPPPPHHQQPQPPPRQQQQVPASFDLFGDSPSVPTTTTSNTHHHQHNMSANLFDTPSVPSGSAGSSSLLDMSYQPTSSSSAVHSDFLGMTSAPSPPVSGNYGGTGGYPAMSQQQQQQQQQQRNSGGTTSSSSFGPSSGGGGGAFGDLAWK